MWVLRTGLIDKERITDGLMDWRAPLALDEALGYGQLKVNHPLNATTLPETLPMGERSDPEQAHADLNLVFSLEYGP